MKDNLEAFGIIHDDLQIYALMKHAVDKKYKVEPRQRGIGANHIIYNWAEAGTTASGEISFNKLQQFWDELKNAGITGGDVVALKELFEQMQLSLDYWNDLVKEGHSTNAPMLIAKTKPIVDEYNEYSAKVQARLNEIISKMPQDKNIPVIEQDKKLFFALTDELRKLAPNIFTKDNISDLTTSTGVKALGDMMANRRPLGMKTEKAGLLKSTKLRRETLKLKIKGFNDTADKHLKGLKDKELCKTVGEELLKGANLKTIESGYNNAIANAKKENEKTVGEYLAKYKLDYKKLGNLLGQDPAEYKTELLRARAKANVGTGSNKFGAVEADQRAEKAIAGLKQKINEGIDAVIASGDKKKISDKILALKGKYPEMKDEIARLAAAARQKG
ncbi:MAG: hypothetical protein FWF97_00230 [Alphaproteobacteria bacterium]|nr:hypothetical protein [Alphaproteobacteria bacterium]